MRNTGCMILALMPLGWSPAEAQAARKLDIGVTAGVQYDTNVARASAAQAAARRLSREDFRFSAGLDLDISLPAGRQELFLQGAIGYVTYARNDRLNRERIDLRGGMNGVFGPCRPKLTLGYSRGQSEVEDLDFSVSVKNSEERRSVQLEARCGRGYGFEPVVGAEAIWARNSNVARERSDYNEYNVSAGIAYSQPTLGDISLTGSYGRTRYPKRLVLVGLDQLTDGYEVYSGGVRYERQIGTRMRGRITASYTKLKSNLPNVKDFDGITYGAQLTLQPTYRLQARFAFDRDIQSSNRLDVNYSLSDTYSAEAEYAIGSRLRLVAGGSIRDRTFEKSGTLPVVGPSDERIRTLMAALRFQQNRRLSFELNAINDNRDADISLFDYSSTRIGLTAKAEF